LPAAYLFINPAGSSFQALRCSGISQTTPQPEPTNPEPYPDYSGDVIFPHSSGSSGDSGSGGGSSNDDNGNDDIDDDKPRQFTQMLLGPSFQGIWGIGSNCSPPEETICELKGNIRNQSLYLRGNYGDENIRIKLKLDLPSNTFAGKIFYQRNRDNISGTFCNDPSSPYRIKVGKFSANFSWNDQDYCIIGEFYIEH